MHICMHRDNLIVALIEATNAMRDCEHALGGKDFTSECRQGLETTLQELRKFPDGGVEIRAMGRPT